MRVHYNPHECDFYSLDCDSYTQSLIFTWSVLSAGKNVITHECNFNTRKIDLNKQWDFDTYECDFTRRVWFPLTQE
jgi:hypothetical protein